MAVKNFFSKINIVGHCKNNYRLPLLQCPQFVFLIMGFIIVGSILLSYFVGNRLISDPLTVAAIVLILTFFLFVLDFIITRSFEKLAEVARLRSDFVRIVSHQLRSPISNIHWTIDALTSGTLGQPTEKQDEYLKILKDNNERMRDLLSHLLMVSRIEEGKMTSKKERISLPEMINTIVKNFMPFALAHNTKIVFDCPPDLPLLLVDPGLLKQVFEIMFDNAIKYGGSRDAIKIKLRQKKNKIICEIADKGLGITKNEQKYIFQKFFRAENVKRLETQGSGLGLFIAKSIIENLGGKIGFQSQENQGSTFWFEIPISQ